ncbi:MAG: sulfatase [Chthoniobacterales bacterium]
MKPKFQSLPGRAALFGLVVVSGALATCAAPPRRPNILFFISDDWGRNASCYRDPDRAGVNDVIDTPNIDRLAREGVLFRNAFYNVSSCTPSRAGMATGCYFWRLGHHALHRMQPEIKDSPDPGWSLPGFGPSLADDGYLLGTWGKTLNRHWFPAEAFPFDEEKVRYSHWVPTQPDRAVAQKTIEGLVRAGVRDMLAKKKKGQPFCHAIGPVGTHRPFTKGSGKSLWNIDPDQLRGKLPAFLPDIPETRESMSDTLGEVLADDLYLGWIVDELKTAGELDNTLLVLTGDNGIGMPRGKTQVYDLGMRAPLIVHWPAGIKHPGRIVDDFVSVIDLAPTFLDLAGLKIPQTMNGRSLLPLLQSDKAGLIDPSRDFTVTGRERHDLNVRDALPYPVRALRTSDFLYVHNFKPDRWPHGDPAEPGFPSDPPERDDPSGAWVLVHRDDPQGKELFRLYYAKRPEEELYDLRNDPDEVKNVAAEPNYSDVKEKLSSRLMEILRTTKDPRLTDEFDRWPYYQPPAHRSAANQHVENDDPYCIAHVNGTVSND